MAVPLAFLSSIFNPSNFSRRFSLTGLGLDPCSRIATFKFFLGFHEEYPLYNPIIR